MRLGRRAPGRPARLDPDRRDRSDVGRGHQSIDVFSFAEDNDITAVIHRTMPNHHRIPAGRRRLTEGRIRVFSTLIFISIIGVHADVSAGNHFNVADQFNRSRVAGVIDVTGRLIDSHPVPDPSPAQLALPVAHENTATGCNLYIPRFVPIVRRSIVHVECMGLVTAVPNLRV